MTTTNDFTKIIRPAYIRRGVIAPEHQPNVYIEIKYLSGKLSLTGVIGPKLNGDAVGGCGQIDMEFEHRDPADTDTRYNHPIKPSKMEFASGWDADKWYNLLDIWRKWHLNDMRPNCEHQQGWNTGQQLTLTELSWGAEFYDDRERAVQGTMTEAEYANYANDAETVYALTISPRRPKHPALWGEDVARLIEKGYLKQGKQETKGAGWVYPEEHPDGLLTKPCPECGYKYGTEWKSEPVPEDVLDFLRELPDTDITPAWV